MDDDKPLTMSVPEAGREFFDLSRNGSYAAAERGDIPYIKVGRRKRVPVQLMRRKLERADNEGGGETS